MIVSEMNVTSVVAVLALRTLMLVAILVMVEANSFNMSAFVFRESQDETKSVMIIVFMLVDGVRIHWAGKPN
ncbi:hypothetical protein [Maricaulis maris]|uniref:hypothetical protein n=1 Tax=Maricaulis maris TaxID=74318 RepID=UPI00032483E1|nr:hypothetical protein [Maricaulis maris]